MNNDYMFGRRLELIDRDFTEYLNRLKAGKEIEELILDEDGCPLPVTVEIIVHLLNDRPAEAKKLAQGLGRERSQLYADEQNKPLAA